MNIYLGEALEREIRQLALKNQRSVSSMVKVLVNEALEARQPPNFLVEALNMGDGTYKP